MLVLGEGKLLVIGEHQVDVTAEFAAHSENLVFRSDFCGEPHIALRGLQDTCWGVDGGKKFRELGQFAASGISTIEERFARRSMNMGPGCGAAHGKSQGGVIRAQFDRVVGFHVRLTLAGSGPAEALVLSWLCLD